MASGTFTDESQSSCTAQMAHSVCGVAWVSWFANINIVNKASRGGRGVIVWAGRSSKGQTQVPFIDVIGIHSNTVMRAAH